MNLKNDISLVRNKNINLFHDKVWDQIWYEVAHQVDIKIAMQIGNRVRNEVCDHCWRELKEYNHG